MENLPSSIPFVGRAPLLAELYQFLSAPASYAVCLQSFEGLGKSLLLTRLTTLDDHVSCALIPLSPTIISSETVFLETLITASHAIMDRDGVNMLVIPTLENQDNLREWLTTTYLPAVGRMMRSQRRLVWLLDDVQVLAEGITNGTLPSDLPAFLHSVLPQFPFVSIICTLDEDTAVDMALLAPLVTVDHTERLSRLTRDESDALLIASLEYVPAPLAEQAYVQTGGLPRLLIHLTEALQSYEPLDEAVELTYQRNQITFRHVWDLLSRDERVVLTAIINLSYDDPLKAITPNLVERWLVDSDNPMDATTINAQLRGLEYRHILRLRPQQLDFVADLFKRWLYEHARLDAVDVPASPRWAIVLALLALVLVVVLVVFAVNALPPAAVVTELPLPTVTLGS